MNTSKTFYIILLLTFIVTFSGCSDFGDQKASNSSNDKRIPLFDGKSLNGWTVINCEAVVDNGDILLKSGNGLVQTQKQYGNFMLELEWKALRDNKWDSGIYFRYNSVPQNRPWPQRYQVNLMQGMEGNISDLKEAQSEGLAKNGQWNNFKLTVQDTRVSLEINGTPAWTADGLEEPARGFIALQAEVPGGGQFRFRNIHLTELD